MKKKTDLKSAEGFLTKHSEEYSHVEPSFSRFPYAGWIPTASGRLSFRHIGESSHPAKSLSANVSSNDGKRFVVAAQVRPLSDVLFKYLFHPLFQLRGEIPFVLSATTFNSFDRDKIILGRIDIFKSKQHWESRKRGSKSIREKISFLIESINQGRYDAGSQYERNVGQYWRNIRTISKANQELCLYFKLFRTGEVYFSSPIYRDATLMENTLKHAQITGHDFGDWIANQAYFFLRDITHKHQHHDAHSDTILVLQQRSPSDPSAWRTNIVYSLHYHIVRAKRATSNLHFVQALGILGYCTSFERISERTGWVKPEYNIESLAQSIESSLKQREILSSIAERSSDKKQSKITTILAGWGVALAILIMMVQPSIEDGDAPKILKTVSIDASLNFFPILFVFIVLSFLYWVLDLDNPRSESNNPRRDLFELFNARRDLFKRVWAVIGVASFSLAIFTGFHWLRSAFLFIYKISTH